MGCVINVCPYVVLSFTEAEQEKGKGGKVEKKALNATLVSP